MNVFGKLPDLFGRDFFVGFLLPGFVIFGAFWAVLDAFEKLPTFMKFESADRLFDAAVVAGISWLTAIALLALNRPIVRTLEGYTFKDWWGFRWLLKRWQKRFATSALPILNRQREIDDARMHGEAAPTTAEDHGEKLRAAVEAYPHSEQTVLPTRFGNRYRAIEVYSHVVYGLDAIPAWGRMEAIMPKEFQARVAEAKAQLDFSINVELAGFLAFLLYAIMGGITRSAPSSWLLGLAAVLWLFGHVSALGALTQYGLRIKSAFDLYRAELAEHLGLELPRSATAEREMWTEVSRMMVYRSPAAWDRLIKYRKR